MAFDSTGTTSDDSRQRQLQRCYCSAMLCCAVVTESLFINCEVIFTLISLYLYLDLPVAHEEEIKRNDCKAVLSDFITFTIPGKFIYGFYPYIAIYDHIQLYMFTLKRTLL